MQKQRTDQLRIKRPQAQCPSCRLATIGKSFGKQIVKTFAIQRALAKLFGFFLDARVRQFFELGFQFIDLGNQRPRRFDLTVIGRPKDLFSKCSDAQHAFSSRSIRVRR